MEIYEIYQTVTLFGSFFGGKPTARFLYGSLALGGGIWLVLFAFQAFGLYAMAKKRELKHRWLAFIPFANVFYIAKLSGQCTFFGRKMKHPGVYVMIAQILATAASAAYIASQILLFTRYADEMIVTESGVPQWPALSGFAMYVRNFYLYGGFIVSIIDLIYRLLLFILMTGLCKKYSAKNYLFLSWIALFIPLSKYIVIFAIRNNKAIDYEAYMRARREEFLRRQQQNPYGGYNPYNPYNRNPYGGPYGPGANGGGTYGNGPYGPPPAGNGGANGGVKNADDPFSEFAPSSSADKANSSGRGTDGTDGGFRPGGGSDPDDLFN